MPDMDRIALVALLLLLALPAWAAPTVANLEALRRQVVDFLAEQAPRGPDLEVAIDVPPLDRRLRLAPCAEPPAIFLPAGHRAIGRTSVGLRCRAPKPWTVYVPARVRVTGPVLVATRPLPRGSRLTAGDFQRELRDLSRLGQDYLTDPKHLLGQVLTRPIAPGRPFRAHFLRPPKVVARGERVTLVARAGGVEVRVRGEALEDAGLGETVRVRNLRSKRVVEGRVRAGGEVEVGL